MIRAPAADPGADLTPAELLPDDEVAEPVTKSGADEVIAEGLEPLISARARLDGSVETLEAEPEVATACFHGERVAIVGAEAAVCLGEPRE